MIILKTIICWYFSIYLKDLFIILKTYSSEWYSKYMISKIYSWIMLIKMSQIYYQDFKPIIIYEHIDFFYFFSFCYLIYYILFVYWLRIYIDKK